jgi:hypothetical protein
MISNISIFNFIAKIRDMMKNMESIKILQGWTLAVLGGTNTVKA